MNFGAYFTGLALLSLGACPGGSQAWPRWAQELGSELRCGMTLEEAQQLAGGHIEALEAGAHPWLGRYYVRRGHTDLWLRFDEQAKLEWVTLSRVNGWRIMATRESPRRNLCTGELTFQVRLDWTAELEGAKVYLDGREVQPEGGKIEVSAGQHEVRIEKAGYQPIIRHLDLGPGDRGDESLDLREVDLRPFGS